MSESFLNGRVTLHCADCREQIVTLADNSIDACVTDPPYALTQASRGGSPRNNDPATPYGRTKLGERGFMGKQWDTGEVAFDPAFWAEVLRVLKPGGHIIAMGGSRTYHRLACAIEDAGFEIRDTIMWVYGSGFPKSHDVSKGIDKARTEDVEPVRVICRAIRQAMDNLGLKSKDLVQHFDGCHPRLIDHWAARDTDSQPALPTWRQWQTLQQVLSLDCSLDEEVWRLNERKGTLGEAWQTAQVVGSEMRPDTTQVRAGFVGMTAPDGKTPLRSVDLRAANSDAARQWQGWGTALKPSWEPCVLARKPLGEKTVAANVLAHGTGALNIDGCRVANDGDNARANKGGYLGLQGGNRPDLPYTANLGRWPANLIHDGSDEVVAAFPDAPGQQAVTGPQYERKNGVTWEHNHVSYSEPRNDSGSAARFFYTSKADADDRLGSKHPTVKPLDLIQYLVRLITPKNGTVLDPFAGTGTTGEAAFREGMRAVLIEREAEYQDDIRRRMKLALGGQDERKRETIKQKTKDQPLDLGPLFKEAAE
jgi:DNA modification methylase